MAHVFVLVFMKCVSGCLLLLYVMVYHITRHGMIFYCVVGELVKIYFVYLLFNGKSYIRMCAYEATSYNEQTHGDTHIYFTFYEQSNVVRFKQ